MQQECAVNQRILTFAILRVAGKLSFAEGEIALTLDRHRFGGQRFHSAAMTVKNKIEGCLDTVAGKTILPENQRVVQTPRPLHYGSAAATAPQHRNSIGSAGGTLDFITPFIAVAEHDKILVRLPDAQQLLAAARMLEKFEQSLIASEILRRIRES